jgi:hypothetical protein
MGSGADGLNGGAVLLADADFFNCRSCPLAGRACSLTRGAVVIFPVKVALQLVELVFRWWS